MKKIDFTGYAKRLAYAHVYGYATLLYNAVITPEFEYLLTDAIHDIREFTVQAEVHHGIVLEMTPAVLDAIEEYARIGWNTYLTDDTGPRRIEDINDLLPFVTQRRTLEMLTRYAFYTHQGEAKQLIVLPIDASALSVKLTYLDCMAAIIEESK